MPRTEGVFRLAAENSNFAALVHLGIYFLTSGGDSVRQVDARSTLVLLCRAGCQFSHVFYGLRMSSCATLCLMSARVGLAEGAGENDDIGLRCQACLGNCKS